MFQAVVKERLSKFKLLKCRYRIFQHRSQTDFVSSRELFKCCSELRLQWSLQYSFARNGKSNFKWLIAGKATESANRSTAVVKRSSIQSDTTPNPNTRHKQLLSERKAGLCGVLDGY